MLWFHPVNMTLVTLASEAIGDLVFSSLVTHLNDASEPDSLLLHRWTYATDQDFRSGLPSTLKTQIKAFYKVKKTKDVAANKAKQKETVDGTVARLNDELMAVAMRLMLQVLEGDHGLQKRYISYSNGIVSMI